MANPSLITDSTPRNNQPAHIAEPALSLVALSREVGCRLRALRRERGLSQEELGWRSGYHRTRISQIERGIANPTLATLHCLALTLEVPLTAFCPGGAIGNDGIGPAG